MTHILMPFIPERACKILNGEITTDVRKRIPKPPFTVWMYCTKGKPYLAEHSKEWRKEYPEPRYFLPDKETVAIDKLFGGRKYLNGLVVAKFVVEKDGKITFQTFNDGAKNWTYRDENGHNDDLLNKSCLNLFQMHKILKGKDGHALPITALEILDKPLQLSDFKHEVDVWVPEFQAFTDELRPLTKAPQSWCRVIPPKAEKEK